MDFLNFEPAPVGVTIFEYTECQASPVVRIGSPRPLTRKRVLHPPPLVPGGDTLAKRESGRGSQFERLERKPGILSIV